jgi:cell division protein FtsL
MSVKPTTTLILLLAIIVSSVGMVYARHQNRMLFVELQALGYEKDRMDVEWGQLQLEQSTMTTHGQVEQAARTRLGMISPGPDTFVILRP